ncbi:MAG: hypothetical protein O3A51_05385 [Verrucomicrobia bacterium]|nr:hypothetical protein [Verrucomicrobiota bacterium]
MISFAVGDKVIYRKSKRSKNPGPRAEGVCPSSSGDDYHYTVEKFWVVTAVQGEQTIEVITRTGKRQFLDRRDPRLRKASRLEELRHRNRFPEIANHNQEVRP